MALKYSQRLDGNTSLEFHAVDNSKAQHSTCKPEKTTVDSLNDEVEGESDKPLDEPSQNDEEYSDRSVSDVISKERALMEKKLLSEIIYRDAGHLVEDEIMYPISRSELSEIVESKEELPRAIFNMSYEVSTIILECNSENRKSYLDSYMRSLLIIKRALLAAEISSELRSLVLGLDERLSTDACSYSDKVVRFTQS